MKGLIAEHPYKIVSTGKPKTGDRVGGKISVMARECKINQNGGQITVQLSVNNGIISGGDFSVYEFESGLIVNSFKMHTDTTGKTSQIINLSAKVIMGKVLSWQILSCSPIITNSCILDVEIFQDGQGCEMNKSAHFTLTNVPNCSLSHALPVKGGLHFVNQLTPAI